MMETATSLKEWFNKKGYKFTSQRKNILDILMEQGAEHLTAGDIYTLVKVKYPDIGMATVYRALSIFEKLHIINKLGLEDELNRYEFNTSNVIHEHHHLICIKCRQIIDIEEIFMEEINEKVLKKYDFIVTDYKQKLYGICSNCLSKEA